MKRFGRIRLAAALVFWCVPALVAQQPQGQQPAPPTSPQTAPQTTPPPRPPNPFENVPESPTPPPPPTPTPQQPPSPAPAQPAAPVNPGQQPFETPKPPAAQAPAQPSGQVIQAVDFRGLRRVPQDSMRAIISTKAGDPYNPQGLSRDLRTLYNTGRFDDVTAETETGRTGIIVTFVVVERRVVRSIEYPGLKSATVSDVLDMFKERHLGLSVESQYDPAKVQRAVVLLKELLAEHGRQYATVDPIIEQIPPSSLSIKFQIDEGPKVKVGEIKIEGNKAFSEREVIRAMKNTHPIGIPYSIVLENLFAKTYDMDKLEEDKEHVRLAYTDKGYFTAKVLDQTVTIRRKGGEGWQLPLIKPNHTGIYADIKLPVEEGRLYHLHSVNFVGVKLFRTPETLMQPLFKMSPGDVFSTAKLRDGLKNIRDLYGQFGYIDMEVTPDFDLPPNSDQVDLTLTADEGKQFFVRRLDFSGNTTTRDKVIRREILIDEGDIFNKKLWDLSILRLNQLGYFQPLKPDEAADIKTNRQTNTVDITLKVQERGKNSIGLNGGVSEIAGSFIGVNYSTNNFLGLGETLSLSGQVGTRLTSANFGFTEPYFLDRPLQLGFTVFISRFDYNQAREASILAGQNLIPLYNSLGTANLLNYIQNSRGFTVSTSYPLRRSFARLGLTYGYTISSIIPNSSSTATETYFEYLDFSGISGPNALVGIHTSSITPSYLYNTVNQPLNPTAGKSLFVSTAFAGSFMGGNVDTIGPALDAKYFKQAPWNKKHVLAFHLAAHMITGYDGHDVPPFSRSFIGGEQDVRGFYDWGISPVGFIPTEATITVLNDDGSARTQTTIVSGAPQTTSVTMTIPTYQVITPGGDTTVVGNFEYRIPIAGPITAALFFDAGMNRILRSSQLTIVSSRTSELNNDFPQAGFTGQVVIAPGTQMIRSSTGLEIQVLMPVVNAPFRVYGAFNPTRLKTNLQPPIVADRSMFPNEATFQSALEQYGQAISWDEKRTMFRFTVGRTF
jgi:outer membrane protein insertion porin family